MSKNIDVVSSYFKALAGGDHVATAAAFVDDVVWHQPGHSKLSGTFTGKGAVFAHLGDFGKLSGGTFAIDNISYVTDNGDLVVAATHFKAEARGKSLSMQGIDLFRIKDGKIAEVWLFSENQSEEDAFWNELSGNA
ncbi:MAG: nuclear transport factor 2 family protein [Burkholderiaceae bacterium]|nr:nuclear transport factor 2 family protein [Burkholderiaceae bacterium]